MVNAKTTEVENPAREGGQEMAITRQALTPRVNPEQGGVGRNPSL